ncbi:MAG TPA: TonB-dependent receptor, partial [Puia sp.]|nr:TonB-dependent receptor [Puia sp.]
MTRKIFLLVWFVSQTSLCLVGGPLYAQTATTVSTQTTVTGTVTNEKGQPLPYASAYFKGSTDAGTADSSGVFSITTRLKGPQVLVLSAVGWKETEYPLVIEDYKHPLTFRLRPVENQLSTVVITAGTIEATNDRLLSIVKPVDVLSNASSTGDIVGAFQNFPGVQRNGGDQSGLFVRGGDATETMMILDGTTVQDPFYSAVPGVGQRSRFNSFQVKGMSFSTGGYSAKYGQALSSVLDLQSTDLPEKTTYSVGANIAGLMFAGSQKMDNNGLEYSGTYTNFGPYYALSKTNFDFYQKPENTNLSARWISKTNNDGLFKMSVNYGLGNSGTIVPDPNDPAITIPFGLHNENLAFNSSYKTPLTSKLRLFTAVGYSVNQDHIRWSDTLFNKHDERVQARSELTWRVADQFKVTTGGEIQHYTYAQRFDT